MRASCGRCGATTDGAILWVIGDFEAVRRLTVAEGLLRTGGGRARGSMTGISFELCDQCMAPYSGTPIRPGAMVQTTASAYQHLDRFGVFEATGEAPTIDETSTGAGWEWHDLIVGAEEIDDI